jgi:cytochrome b6-f complex iron-sulfur subunit
MDEPETPQEPPGQSRREFVDYIVGAAFAGTALAAAYGAYNYLVPPAVAHQVGEAVTVGDAAALPVGEGRVFPFANTGALVIHLKDRFVAFDPSCTHLACLVQWDAARGQIVCPCHGGAFDANGNVVSGPPPRPLAPLAVAEVNGKLVVSRA